MATAPAASAVKYTTAVSTKTSKNNRTELTAQIGIRPLPDRRADFAHLFRSFVGPIHLADKRHGIKQARHRDQQHDPECDLFERRIGFITQEMRNT